MSKYQSVSHWQSGTMAPQTSPLWDHFVIPDGDYRKAKCLHCETVVSRGGPETPRSKCYNRSMQVHMEVKHKEELTKVLEKRAERKELKKDSKDETVRGTLPIFSLKNKEQKAAFLKLVSIIIISLFIHN